MRSCSVSEAATSVQSLLDTITSKVHSFITRHLTSRSSEYHTDTTASSPRMPDRPPGSSEAVDEESQTESDLGWLDLGSAYTKQPDDDNNFEKDAWLCFDLETKLRRQADYDDILQGLKRRMERDKAQLKSWGNFLSRQTCLLEDGKSRSKTEQGRKDIDAWKGCLGREFSRYRVEEHKLREAHNSNLTTFLSRYGLSHLSKRDAHGWVMIPEEEDYLPLWRRSALRSNDT